MTITIKEHEGVVKIDISGMICTLSDTQSIKDAIDSITPEDHSICLNIIDSFSISSTLIAYLLRKVRTEKLPITIMAHEKRLQQQLKALSLTDIIPLEKIPS